MLHQVLDGILTVLILLVLGLLLSIKQWQEWLRRALRRRLIAGTGGPSELQPSQAGRIGLTATAHAQLVFMRSDRPSEQPQSPQSQTVQSWLKIGSKISVISRSKAPALLLAVAVLIAIVALLLPRVPQPQAYHNFADHRGWMGVPNFGDVASNLPFAIVGIWGLVVLFAAHTVKFADPRERLPYVVMFVGLILTAIGSAYYHLAPGNARLVWDRLPMTIVFMSLIAAMIAERVSVSAGLASFPVLLIVGAASVLQWRASELEGHGDLRFYAAVQVYSIVVLLLVLFIPPKYTRNSDFAVVVAFYILAKVLEETDRQIFALGRVISGHTLKHLTAAAAGYWILRMLKKREPLFH